MIPSQIEREILIDAPVDVVWRIITEPEQIAQWFSQEAELETRPGGRGRLRFPSGQSYQLQIESLEPPHRFAFRWVQPEGSVVRADNSLLVEFTLLPEAGATRLLVVESGFDAIDWSDPKKSKYVDEHSGGWSRALGRLAEHALRVQEAGAQ